ncbi:MAG: flagellar biosynthesis anti-sigma factor FlgM [Deltaproteobacteria bacterium]|nr:flagellar biosynthesis anti-sigma factor FlgM [Deltaproteobacteria bacterium]MBW2152874.1 flagellar biosynthesis anti-sigma factor FlgM [Deltaproteobacteria bacterium]
MGNVINITNKYDNQVFAAASTENRRVERQAAENTAEVLQNDKVSLSNASKDMRLAKKAVASVPDIRSEKVDPIKKKVAQGQYRVDAEKVADKMIGHYISEFV